MAVNQILLNYLPLSTFYYPYIQHPLGGTGTYNPYVPYIIFFPIKFSEAGNFEVEI